jgi:hypothetical protein
VERTESANISIYSAMATLKMVLNEADIRNAIVGVPLFTHTMIAFSAVFLLKVAWKWSAALLNIDVHQVHDLVQSIIDLMSNSVASIELQQANSDGNHHIFDMTIGPPQDLLADTEGLNGIGFGYSWSDFPISLDYFPVPLQPMPDAG